MSLLQFYLYIDMFVPIYYNSDMDKWHFQKSGAYLGQNNPNYRGGKEVPCTFCGKLVYRGPSDIDRSKRHFCSPRCHDDFRRKPKNKIPRNEMQGTKHPRWTGQRFCRFCGIELLTRKTRGLYNCLSSECRERANKERQHKGEKHPQWKGNDVVSNCPVCRKEISFRPGRPKKYCSNECRHIGRRNRVTLKCLHCNSDFMVTAWRVKDFSVKFCSVKCYFSSRLKTTLETKIAVGLSELKIEFVDEYRPKDTKRIFDFFIPSLNVLLEVDGDFWHYSEWARKKGQSKRDKVKEEWAKDNKYNFIRLRESEVDSFGAKELLEIKLGLL